MRTAVALLIIFNLLGSVAPETSRAQLTQDVLTACRVPEIQPRRYASSIHSMHVLGIDIGDSFSKFAVTDSNGTAHTVENAWQQRKTPSLVSLRNGVPAVGELSCS